MTTYNQLLADVQQWLQRNDADVIAQIPTFVRLAEQQIARDCKNIGLTKFVISSPLLNGGGFTPGNAVVPKPTGWRRPLSFSCYVDNQTRLLELRAIEFLEMYWPNDNLTGIPAYYADYGIDYIKVAPTPDLNYPFKISYLELPQPLTENNQTNWMTDYIPDILLFCTLMNSMPYVKNDERLPVWKQEYADKIAALNNQDTQRILDKGSNREAD